MFKNITIKSLALLTLSALLMGLAVDFMILGEVGGDAMTTLVDGISRVTHLGVSSINWWVNMVFIILAFILMREKSGVGTVAYPLICSLGMKLFFMVLPEISGIALQYVYFTVGLIVMCISIGISVYCDCGGNGLILVCLSVSEKLHIDYSWGKSVVDAIMLIGGMLLGGSYGLGTIASVLLVGKISGWMIQKFEFLK